MMKAMDSARGQGANHSNTRRYCEDLQRCHRVEDTLSCFEISGLTYYDARAASNAASDRLGLSTSTLPSTANAAPSSVNQLAW
jgi:hypothetical protein